jgi:hypothetical protein
VRLVAGDAALAQPFMGENERPCLSPVARGARLIHPAHPQPPGGFEDVHPVSIVALNTVDLALHQGMMLRQPELRRRHEMALKTHGGLPAGIDYGPASSASRGDVQAARTVTTFTPGLFAGLRGLHPHTRVRAGRK